jgi:hypothetical protein
MPAASVYLPLQDEEVALVRRLALQENRTFREQVVVLFRFGLLEARARLVPPEPIGEVA